MVSAGNFQKQQDTQQATHRWPNPFCLVAVRILFRCSQSSALYLALDLALSPAPMGRSNRYLPIREF